MSILQKAPPASSPANDPDRYTVLVNSINSVLAGRHKDAPKQVAAGIDAIDDVANAFFDIRRFQRQALWRRPFTTAIGSFLGAPSVSHARASALMLAAARYESCRPFETAVIFLVRASLDVAWSERRRAAAYASIASERAEAAFNELGYRAEGRYVQSFRLLRGTAATLAELIACETANQPDAGARADDAPTPTHLVRGSNGASAPKVQPKPRSSPFALPSDWLSTSLQQQAVSLR